MVWCYITRPHHNTVCMLGCANNAMFLTVHLSLPSIRLYMSACTNNVMFLTVHLSLPSILSVYVGVRQQCHVCYCPSLPTFNTVCICRGAPTMSCVLLSISPYLQYCLYMLGCTNNVMFLTVHLSLPSILSVYVGVRQQCHVSYCPSLPTFNTVCICRRAPTMSCFLLSISPYLQYCLYMSGCANNVMFLTVHLSLPSIPSVYVGVHQQCHVSYCPSLPTFNTVCICRGAPTMSCVLLSISPYLQYCLYMSGCANNVMFLTVHLSLPSILSVYVGVRQQCHVSYCPSLPTFNTVCICRGAPTMSCFLLPISPYLQYCLYMSGCTNNVMFLTAHLSLPSILSVYVGVHQQCHVSYCPSLPTFNTVCICRGAPTMSCFLLPISPYLQYCLYMSGCTNNAMFLTVHPYLQYCLYMSGCTNNVMFLTVHLSLPSIPSVYVGVHQQCHVSYCPSLPTFNTVCICRGAPTMSCFLLSISPYLQYCLYMSGCTNNVMFLTVHPTFNTVCICRGAPTMSCFLLSIPTFNTVCICRGTPTMPCVLLPISPYLQYCLYMSGCANNVMFLTVHLSLPSILSVYVGVHQQCHVSYCPSLPTFNTVCICRGAPTMSCFLLPISPYLQYCLYMSGCANNAMFLTVHLSLPSILSVYVGVHQQCHVSYCPSLPTFNTVCICRRAPTMSCLLLSISPYLQYCLYMSACANNVMFVTAHLSLPSILSVYVGVHQQCHVSYCPSLPTFNTVCICRRAPTMLCFLLSISPYLQYCLYMSGCTNNVMFLTVHPYLQYCLYMSACANNVMFLTVHLSLPSILSVYVGVHQQCHVSYCPSLPTFNTVCICRRAPTMLCFLLSISPYLQYCLYMSGCTNNVMFLTVHPYLQYCLYMSGCTNNVMFLTAHLSLPSILSVYVGVHQQCHVSYCPSLYLQYCLYMSGCTNNVMFLTVHPYLQYCLYMSGCANNVMFLTVHLSLPSMLSVFVGVRQQCHVSYCPSLPSILSVYVGVHQQCHVSYCPSLPSILSVYVGVHQQCHVSYCPSLPSILSVYVGVRQQCHVSYCPSLPTFNTVCICRGAPTMSCVLLSIPTFNTVCICRGAPTMSCFLLSISPYLQYCLYMSACTNNVMFRTVHPYLQYCLYMSGCTNNVMCLTVHLSLPSILSVYVGVHQQCHVSYCPSLPTFNTVCICRRAPTMSCFLLSIPTFNTVCICRGAPTMPCFLLSISPYLQYCLYMWRAPTMSCFLLSISPYIQYCLYMLACANNAMFLTVHLSLPSILSVYVGVHQQCHVCYCPSLPTFNTVCICWRAPTMLCFLLSIPTFNTVCICRGAPTMSCFLLSISPYLQYCLYMSGCTNNVMFLTVHLSLPSILSVYVGVHQQCHVSYCPSLPTFNTVCICRGAPTMSCFLLSISPYLQYCLYMSGCTNNVMLLTVHLSLPSILSVYVGVHQQCHVSYCPSLPSILSVYVRVRQQCYVSYCPSLPTFNTVCICRGAPTMSCFLLSISPYLQYCLYMSGCTNNVMFLTVHLSLPSILSVYVGVPQQCHVSYCPSLPTFNTVCICRGAPTMSCLLLSISPYLQYCLYMSGCANNVMFLTVHLSLPSILSVYVGVHQQCHVCYCPSLPTFNTVCICRGAPTMSCFLLSISPYLQYCLYMSGCTNNVMFVTVHLSLPSILSVYVGVRQQCHVSYCPSLPSILSVYVGVHQQCHVSYCPSLPTFNTVCICRGAPTMSCFLLSISPYLQYCLYMSACANNVMFLTVHLSLPSILSVYVGVRQQCHVCICRGAPTMSCFLLSISPYLQYCLYMSGCANNVMFLTAHLSLPSILSVYVGVHQQCHVSYCPSLPTFNTVCICRGAPTMSCFLLSISPYLQYCLYMSACANNVMFLTVHLSLPSILSVYVGVRQQCHVSYCPSLPTFNTVCICRGAPTMPCVLYCPTLPTFRHRMLVSVSACASGIPDV